MIDAQAQTIEQLFLSGVFAPARIQRTFCWTERECAALVDDLERAFKLAGLDPDPHQDIVESDPEDAVEDAPLDEPAPEPERPVLKLKPPKKRDPHYFLGQILLMPRNDARSFYVFDGQQRLTALTILLCVLRVGMQGNTLRRLKKMIFAHADPRLTAPSPGGTLARIVSGNIPLQASQSAPDRLLARAHETFENKCSSWSDNKRREFVDYIRNYVTVIATKIEDRGLAEAAYQTTNTRGKLLDSSDLVKGHLVELVGRQAPTLANKVAQTWERLRRELSDQFDRFLEAVVFLENCGADVRGYAAVIMDAFDGREDIPKAQHWVQDRLVNCAEVWKALRAHLHQNPCVGVNIHLRRLSFIEWQYWLPVAMKLSMRDENAPVRFMTSVKALERWCFVMNILGHSEGRIAHACGDAIEQISEGIDPFKYRTRKDQQGTGSLYIPRAYKERARANLYAPMEDVSRVGAHMRWLETLYWSDQLPHAPTNDTSVEHVLPKSPTGLWTQVFGPEIIARDTDRLGNLCLLPKQLNSNLGNSQYAEKRAAYLKLPQQHRSALEVAQSEEWTPEIVDQRTTELAERAIRALNI